MTSYDMLGVDSDKKGPKQLVKHNVRCCILLRLTLMLRILLLSHLQETCTEDTTTIWLTEMPDTTLRSTTAYCLLHVSLQNTSRLLLSRSLD